MANAKVSVVIPVYNSSEYIEKSADTANPAAETHAESSLTGNTDALFSNKRFLFPLEIPLFFTVINLRKRISARTRRKRPN